MLFGVWLQSCPLEGSTGAHKNLTATGLDFVSVTCIVAHMSPALTALSSHFGLNFSNFPHLYIHLCLIYHFLSIFRPLIVADRMCSWANSLNSLVSPRWPQLAVRRGLKRIFQDGTFLTFLFSGDSFPACLSACLAYVSVWLSANPN